MQLERCHKDLILNGPKKPNWDILPAGLTPPDPTRLLTSNKMKELLCSLSLFYAYNTNWGNRNLPGKAILGLEGISAPKKTEKLNVTRNGKYVFHLSMPYTIEVSKNYQ